MGTSKNSTELFENVENDTGIDLGIETNNY